MSIATLFIKKETVAKIIDNLANQGFSISLLLVVVWYMHGEIQYVKQDAARRDKELRQEIKTCTDAHIHYLQEQQQKTTNALIDAASVMKRIEKKLD